MSNTLFKCFASAVLMSPFVGLSPAQAGADYCHTDLSGNYVCIQSVFGPRSNRGMVYTMNGYVYSTRFNCYARNYGSTSIMAIACWSYTGIKSEPADAPEVTEVPKSIRSIMSEGGFVSEDRAVDLDGVMNAMPPEMK